MNKLKDAFLELNEDQFSINIKDTVREWNNFPKSNQILKTLECDMTYTNKFIISSLFIMFNSALRKERDDFIFNTF